ncbi:hypothetical protein CEXT_526331 [Caerostris extrusa]|uniref:Uncharacterized protein n=1 Tax=Caerostris extrusa TaxID=172846 RepID=A0AAV4TB49_CAEEX|nr:hypothetical protein CEXT_526331 [Caerostris extrusa]
MSGDDDNCLTGCQQKGINSIAFKLISRRTDACEETGVFMFMAITLLLLCPKNNETRTESFPFFGENFFSVFPSSVIMGGYPPGSRKTKKEMISQTEKV